MGETKATSRIGGRLVVTRFLAKPFAFVALLAGTEIRADTSAWTLSEGGAVEVLERLWGVVDSSEADGEPNEAARLLLGRAGILVFILERGAVDMVVLV